MVSSYKVLLTFNENNSFEQCRCIQRWARSPKLVILKIKIKISNFDDLEDQDQDHFKQVILKIKIKIMILKITFQAQDHFYQKLLFEVLLRHLEILNKAKIVVRIISYIKK